MTRRQLEYESKRLRELMTEDMGTSEQIAQRHEARLQRIRSIETEMLRLQQRHREQVYLYTFTSYHTQHYQCREYLQYK